MLSSAVIIEAVPLKLKLKTTIRHASATRNEGESIWVNATRNGHSGYGEGCPRTYVAGDELESSIAWIKENFSKSVICFTNFPELMSWIEKNSREIDKYPSAWCAVEMALLDLFARENECSVEELLGLRDSRLFARCTAVLGNDKTWKYITLADKYLIRGLTDFKIKISGDLENDRKKIALLEELASKHKAKNIRIRLDANNLWKDRCDEAIEYIMALNGGIFALEEPVGARNPEDISRISTSTGIPVILDESLCTFRDLSFYKNLPGKFIANIKISRVGGLVRALKLIEELKKIRWPVIIGCHVGETSLLTRAALTAAFVAGESLVAYEGAFGDYLIGHEPAEPMLKFGHEGILNLDFPYYLKTVGGLKIIQPDNWKKGFGMNCRMPRIPGDGNPEIGFLEMPDKYKTYYRLWGDKKGENALLILHGGMSHSGWQAPLAKSLRLISPDVTVVASDRRGCGLNENHGDLGSVPLVIGDIVKQIEFLKKSFKRVHLAGWCQGAQYAAVAAAETGSILESLILLTPGFFWNERFRSVLSIAEKIVMDMIAGFKLKPEREQACIPIPMEPTDFTLDDGWLDFIENDKLKTNLINLKSVSIMDEIQELSWFAMLKNRLPVLAVLAENDRIVDNNKVVQFLDAFLAPEGGNRMIKMKTAHAVHFEKAEEVAAEILNFISALPAPFQRDRS